MPGALPILLGLTLLGYLSRRRGDGVGQDADQGGPPDEGPPPDDGGGGYYQGDQGSPSMADLVAAANGGDDATIQWFRQQGRNACGIVGPPCVMDDIGLWVMPEAAPMEAPTPGYETMTFRPTWIWSDEHGGWFNRERPWERWEGHGTPPGAPRPGAPGSPGVPWHEPSGPAHGGLGVHPGWPAPHGAPPAAHGGPVLGHGGGIQHHHAEALPGLAQHRDVACGLLAEREVLPDDHLDDVQTFDEQFVDVAVGSQLHEVRGEGHYQEDVDAHFLDQLGAARQRGQLCGMAAREDDFHGMGVERHQDRRHSARSAGLDGMVDELRVSAVHSVEHADRDDASAPVRGDLILTPPALHDR